MKSKTILIVEDDKRLGTLIKDYLKKQSFTVSVEERGDKAVGRILKEKPDLVILDLMLPGLDGISICREVRKDYKGTILMLTAKEDDFDQVAGLETGADDYVKKPVDPRVLLARVRALFRRECAHQDSPMAEPLMEQNYTFGGLDICQDSRRVSLNGEVVDLSSTEFDLLSFLAAMAGKTVSRERIYQELKGVEYCGLDRSVDITVSQLRKKLGDNPEKPCRIKTIWGKGYLFVKDAW